MCSLAKDASIYELYLFTVNICKLYLIYWHLCKIYLTVLSFSVAYAINRSQ